MKSRKGKNTDQYFSSQANEGLEEFLQLDEKDSLESSSELSFIFSKIHKYPLLTQEQERELTSRIFEGKIAVLTEIAVSEPIFIYYLNIILAAAGVAEEDEEGLVSPGFLNYLNTNKTKSGKKRALSEFRKNILKLKEASLQAQKVQGKNDFPQKRAEVSSLLKKINFSWTRLNKDHLFDLVPPGSQEWRALKADMNQMFNHNLRLAVSVAKQFFPFNPHHGDLLQQGLIGLQIGIERFDPRMGNRFSTYATQWIRQSVHRWASQFLPIRIPVHLADKIGKLKSRERRHPEWRDDDFARDMGYPVVFIQKLRTISKQTQTISLDEPVYNDPSKDGADSIGTFVSDPNQDLEKDVIDLMMYEQLITLVKERLTPREYEVLMRRLGLDNHKEGTLDEIGEIFQVSRERIRQIEVKAIKKLKKIPFLRQLVAQ